MPRIFLRIQIQRTGFHHAFIVTISFPVKNIYMSKRWGNMNIKMFFRQKLSWKQDRRALIHFRKISKYAIFTFVNLVPTRKRSSHVSQKKKESSLYRVESKSNLFTKIFWLNNVIYLRKCESSYSFGQISNSYQRKCCSNHCSTLQTLFKKYTDAFMSQCLI